MNNFSVYKHIFPNGKIYIGITCQKPEYRWANGGGYQHNCYMQNAINKYGWANVEHEILFSGLTKEDAEKKEIELIEQYKSNKREYGYNIENGGNHRGRMSEETKRKLSKAFKNRILSEETKNKISKSNTGKKASLETRRKLSESHKGKKYNFDLTKEQREQYAKRCRENAKNQRIKINQYDKNNKLIKTWESARTIENEIGYNHSNIIQCCKKRYGFKTAYGFIWRYCE